MKSGEVYRDGKTSTRSTTLAKDETASEQRSNREKSNALTVRRLKTRSEIEVWTLIRVGARGCGINRRIGRCRGSTWSREQAKTNGFVFVGE